MSSTVVRGVAGAAVIALSLTACAKTEDGTGNAAQGFELVISTDLPLQGTSATQSESTNKLIQLYLDQVGGKAGKYSITLKTYDDSTAAKGAWDDAACAKNAVDHVANTQEVAVMGTFNSGCAKIEVPTLNQDGSGPMLMVSNANTNPGLTKTWETGEPDKYYPSGKRSYARVVTTDDHQGSAAATFAHSDLDVKKCYVLNDNQTYGLGVAKVFADAAKKAGVEIVGEQAWDAKQPHYTALFQAVKSSGADCVYLAGIYDNNGGQLVKDKVAVLGANTQGEASGARRLQWTRRPLGAASGRGHVHHLRWSDHRPAGPSRGAARQADRGLQGKVRRGPHRQLRPVRGRRDTGHPRGCGQVRRNQGRCRQRCLQR